jgi:hypothetical protein
MEGIWIQLFLVHQVSVNLEEVLLVQVVVQEV